MYTNATSYDPMHSYKPKLTRSHKSFEVLAESLIFLVSFINLTVSDAQNILKVCPVLVTKWAKIVTHFLVQILQCLEISFRINVICSMPPNTTPRTTRRTNNPIKR